MEHWTPVCAHAEWIALFRETLYGPGVLTFRMVADDNACEVGQWLNQRHNSIGHLPEYRATRDTHQKFHRRAAYCLRLANAGRKFDALAETEDQGELRRLSRMLVKNLQDLRRKAGDHRFPVREL